MFGGFSSREEKIYEGADMDRDRSGHFHDGDRSIEIIAGIAVAVKPKFGALVVTVWLWGIIIDLLLVPEYFDAALRDLGLSFGALALARLAEREE
jgi:hypothetical protein